jgi:hypothetical protein
MFLRQRRESISFILTLYLYKAASSHMESLSPSVIPYPYLEKRRNHPWHYC